MSDQFNNDDKKLELDHEYDGIKEYNHPLPRWWLITFYGTVIFGFGYFFYYGLGKGPTLQDEHKQQMSVHQVVRDKYMEQMQQFDSKKFEEIYASEAKVQYGESLYLANCQSCHAAGGKGDIGPNLADNFWLFSMGTPDSVYPFLLTGSSNGMPAWSDKLEKDDIYSVLAYVLHLQGKAPADGKAPEGSEFPSWKPGMSAEVAQ